MRNKWKLYAVIELFVIIAAELPSKLFDLPSLIVSVEQPYLIRNQTTNLTCLLSAGWSGAFLADVVWIKDGRPVRKLSKHHETFQQDGNVLTVMDGRSHSEGDYQCIADVRNISLSNKQIIDTKLTSSPVKMRRARMTRFDKTTEYMVSARQGEIARLPCIGIPDVIPGPPEICFEKEGTQGCFGEQREFEDEIFLTTSTGMQITNVQPHHAGNYYCVVRNEYTKATKRSHKPVILLVLVGEQLDDDEDTDFVPELVYPPRPSTISKPIDHDVVAGQDVLLECVITNAEIHWIRHTDTNQVIVDTSDDSRVQILWGNLKIRYVRTEDSGLYSCNGTPMRNSSVNSTEELIDSIEHPVVYFNLVVHRPTRVQMVLTENPYDNSWELFCNASNMKYEIPMIFVNGSNLLDIIPSMGIALETNFFMNPIRLTLRPNRNFSGSVQCISRPAMDEAEIYGTDMDRGSSRNFFVSSSRLNKGDLIIEGPQNSTVLVGESTYLVCNTTRVKSRYWKKNGSYVRVYEKGGRASIIGSHTLHIRNVQISDEGWYTCIVTGEGNLENSAKAYLKVVTETTQAPETTTTTAPEYILEIRNLFVWSDSASVFSLQWEVDGPAEGITAITGQRIERSEEENPTGNWTITRLLEPEVRNTTIDGLQVLKKYRFRLVILRKNASPVFSNMTEYVAIDPQAVKNLILLTKRSKPAEVYVRWIHHIATASEKATSYILSYWALKENINVMTLRGNETETIIRDLDPESSYTFQIRSLSQNGKSILSQVTNAESLSSSSDKKSCGLLSCGAFIRFFLSVFLISLVVIAAAIYFKRRTKKTAKILRKLDFEGNGKFLDTSFTIYREHKASESIMDRDRHSLATTCLAHEIVNDQAPLHQEMIENALWSQKDSLDETSYLMKNFPKSEYIYGKKNSCSSCATYSDMNC